MNRRDSPFNIRLRDRLAAYSAHTGSVMRVGLGVTIFLAGAHKLVAPTAWTTYAPAWLVDLWPAWLLTFELFMVLNGLIEVGFGLGLLANVYTTVLAAITAISLFSVVVMLAPGALLRGEYVDVLVRDLGLTVLAVAVTLEAASLSVDSAPS